MSRGQQFWVTGRSVRPVVRAVATFEATEAVASVVFRTVASVKTSAQQQLSWETVPQQSGPKSGAAVPLSVGELGPHLKPWFHVKIKLF